VSGFRVCLAAVMVSCLCVSAALAEGDLTSQGTKQVIFGFSGFTLSSYGAGVGIRYFFADGAALTPAVGISLERSDDNGTDYDTRYYDEWDTSDERYTSFNAKMTVEKYISESGDVLPYFGGGMGYTYRGGDRTAKYYSEDFDTTDPANIEDVDWTDHTVSLFFAFGFQWRFAEKVSLGGQYSLVLSHRWYKSESNYESMDRIRTRTSDEETTSFDAAAGQLLLSIKI
jgi:hypothetical protein